MPMVGKVTTSLAESNGSVALVGHAQSGNGLINVLTAATPGHIFRELLFIRCYAQVVAVTVHYNLYLVNKNK